MPSPDFQSIMLPLVRMLSDGRERTIRDLTNALADHFHLTAEERQELLPSGGQTLFNNRVAWAKSHLKSAGLIENPTRGVVRISQLGSSVLLQNPPTINCRFLKQYPSYLRFIGYSDNESSAPNKPLNEEETVESLKTPLEMIDSSFEVLNKATAKDLLDRLSQCSPSFFEQVVVRLLQAMGYGATGEALVTGQSGDGGIDGIIKEDKLGLDVVCVQAKRWSGTVGRPIIQAFVGSMDYVRARKGVVLTTSNFSQDASQYIGRIEGKKVVLIDGDMLAKLMIEYDVGVSVTKCYELKEVSNDFFEEDQ